MKIHYEKHPVSKERKAELNKQGYRVIDIRFQPESERQEEKPKRTARAKKKAD